MVVALDDGVDGDEEGCGCKLVGYVFGDVYSCFKIVFIRLMTTKTRKREWFTKRRNFK